MPTLTLNTQIFNIIQQFWSEICKKLVTGQENRHSMKRIALRYKTGYYCLSLENFIYLLEKGPFYYINHRYSFKFILTDTVCLFAVPINTRKPVITMWSHPLHMCRFSPTEWVIVFRDYSALGGDRLASHHLYCKFPKEIYASSVSSSLASSALYQTLVLEECRHSFWHVDSFVVSVHLGDNLDFCPIILEMICKKIVLSKIKTHFCHQKRKIWYS